MKTQEVKTISSNKSVSNNAPTKLENVGINPEKVNGLPISTDFNGESKKDEPKKPDETPATEPTKEKEIKEVEKTEIKFQKPALNLEMTLKLVEELHRRKIQRDRLLETIDTLEAFEVAQIDDADQTDSNHFQGCVLTIEDDERRKFTTKNPVIIQAVAQFVNSMCVNRLSEIEAGITIPA